MNDKLAKAIRKVSKKRGWDVATYRAYKKFIDSLNAEGRAQAKILMKAWEKEDALCATTTDAAVDTK